MGRENEEEKGYSKVTKVLLALLVLIIITNIVLICIFPKDTSNSFVLIMGLTSEFYIRTFIIMITVSVAGIFWLLLVSSSGKKSKKIRRVLGVGLSVSLFAFVGIVANYANRFGSYIKKPDAVSPDGKHCLYKAGGDKDIFDTSSGYMHYAQKVSGNRFERVFFTYSEDLSPEIEWEKDGFLVKYKSPEDTSSKGYSVCPESSQTSDFTYEERSDGYFFYYDKNN